MRKQPTSRISHSALCDKADRSISVKLCITTIWELLKTL